MALLRLQRRRDGINVTSTGEQTHYYISGSAAYYTYNFKIEIHSSSSGNTEKTTATTKTGNVTTKTSWSCDDTNKIVTLSKKGTTGSNVETTYKYTVGKTTKKKTKKESENFSMTFTYDEVGSATDNGIIYHSAIEGYYYWQ